VGEPAEHSLSGPSSMTILYSSKVEHQNVK
jgi:hypothetical protein